MGKKKDKKREDDAAALPKFGGFQSLAGGLEGFKKQLDAEEKKKAEEAARKNMPPPKPKPAPAAPARSTPTSRADDELTFHRMMSGVVPLDAGGRGRVPVTGDPSNPPRGAGSGLHGKVAEVQARAKEEAQQALDRLHSLVDDTARFEVTDDGRRVEGRRADAPADLVRSLRRGMLPVDGRLDLRGLAPEAARDELVEFLRTMRTRGERCVLVIHGAPGSAAGDPSSRSERSDQGVMGVLRGEIAAWLSQGKAKESVLAFATARADDGGEGAVYVALRR